MTSLIAKQVTKIIAPLMILVSIHFFLQGHNKPGGGFIAGTMTAAAISLKYIVFGLEGFREITERQHENTHGAAKRYIPLSGLGLTVALGTGLASMALGMNFLQHRMGDIHLPLFGKIHWTSALVFDLGVYLAVVGSALTMIEVLARQ